jgi:hypothetical protein
MTNHSLYWEIPAEGVAGQIINEHSGLCLTADDAGGVHLGACGTNLPAVRMQSDAAQYGCL